jgi:hypothetical protein
VYSEGIAVDFARRWTACLRFCNAAILAPVLFTTGCAFGPRAIEKTHNPYAEAVQKVEEEQFLRNIVRLRYLESPSSLEIASIAAQYELSATAEARPFFGTESAGSPPVFQRFQSVLPFASISGSNRPTVSMSPQDDASSVRQFLTPISMDTLVFLAQSGWPVADVLRIWIDRVNGVPNRVASGPVPREVAPDYERFQRVCEILQHMQDREMLSLASEERAAEVSGPLPAAAITATAAVEAAKNGFEYRPKGDGKTWVLVRKERKLTIKVNPSAKNAPEMAGLAKLLNLKPNLNRYDLVLATGVTDPLLNPTPPGDEFRLTPRSTAQAHFYLASGVDVPAAHLASGVAPTPHGTHSLDGTRDLLHVQVCAGHKRPTCAYIAVRYRDHWFYIDDRDQDSKSTIFLLMHLRRLDFKRQQIGGAPTLTLPVGR